MAVMIKNMKMPSCCWDTKKNGKEYECPIYHGCANRKSLVPNCKPSNCPLVEIEEPRKGHWIKGDSWSEGCGMGETYGCYYECSNCGGTVQGDYSKCSYSYCPNCGADMREVEE